MSHPLFGPPRAPGPPLTARAPFFPFRGRRRAALGLVAALAASACPLRAAYMGPVPAPADPYGQAGAYAVEVRTFPSPDFPGQLVTVYVPWNAGPRPTWFFAPGYGFNDPTIYRTLLNHLAAHGWTVVFSPYPTGQPDSVTYPAMADGFARAAALYPDAIDTRKVGFAGHSYGASAVPALALKAIRSYGWGSAACCLFVMAPAFLGQLSASDLQSFPSGTQLVVQVYEDDVVNDHRMGIDLFRSIGIRPADKNYLLVRSDQVDGFGYLADHLTMVVPGSGVLNGLTVSENALGAWAVLRIAAALSSSSFDGDPVAHALALGTGGDTHVQMGTAADGRALRPMAGLSDPHPLFPHDRYNNRFDNRYNPRGFQPPPEYPPVDARLVNISARAYSAPGAGALIVGAVVEGRDPKSLLIRGVGPGLVPLGVAGVLANPALTTYRGQASDLKNNGWSTAWNLPAVYAASQDVGAFSLSAGSGDSALLADVDPGAFTVGVEGPGSPGIVLVELFDSDLDTGSQLVNLSARGYVGTGPQVLIAGFVISGTAPETILIRAIGPTLAQFGVNGVIAHPQLVLFDSLSATIATNAGWGLNPVRGASSVPATLQAATPDSFGQANAFALPAGSADCAIVATLPPGQYTAQVSGLNSTTGIALIELYKAQ